MKKLYTIIIVGLIITSWTKAQTIGLSSTAPKSLDKINSMDLDEAVPFLTLDGKRIYFTRTNKKSSSLIKSNVLHEIWSASLVEASSISIEKAPKPLNSGLNSAVIGFNQDASTLYLFGTYNKLFQNQKGVSLSKLENETWSKPTKLTIPELDIEGGFYGLYMHTSERVLLVSKGKSGNEDLYVALKDSNGDWSKPINLGNTINTSSFEISPFITEDLKHLFFSRGSASENTDIFTSERLDDTWTNWSTPKRLLAPINSSSFDAYFSMLPDSTITFSSNRAGSSDIYLAKLIPQVEGIEEGTSSTPSIKKANREQPEPRQVELPESSNRYIFFDFDKSAITNSQMRTLNRVVEHIKSNPQLFIQIGGHTDYIDSESFNVELSNNRALAVANYLMSKGISKNRLAATGFGEEYPISNNRHAYGRRLNRRVEIKFLRTTQ